GSTPRAKLADTDEPPRPCDTNLTAGTNAVREPKQRSHYAPTDARRDADRTWRPRAHWGRAGRREDALARELLREAEQRGCVCLTGRCSEMEGAPPFAPFIEITEQGVRLVPQAARAAMGEQAAEIAMMVPSLRRTFSDVPPTPEVPVDQQRRLLFTAYLEYV